MARIGPVRWWDIALAFFLVIQQINGDGSVCRTGCKGASQTFKYAQGTTYKYNYDGKIEISLSSAEGQLTSTEVKATVLLTQLADCNQLLRLQDVQILGSNGKRLGTIPDVEKPIRINVNDGHFEDSICIENGDTQNSLNIKRSIASIFQASLKSGYETDVFGVCPTEVAQHQEGNLLVIQKTRNLNKCAYREHVKQDFFVTVFNPNSELKSSPLLDGNYNARLEVKGGILNQANIAEDYLFVPFSVGKNGAKAHINSKLQLVGTSKDNPKSQCNKPRSIIFENPHPVVAPTSNVNSILTAVKDTLKTIDVVVGEKTAKEFVTLVKALRAAKKTDILSVYNQVRSGVGFTDKNVAKRIYLDALLQAATGESAEAAITLLKNNELNEVEKKLVYVGLSLVQHASESSLTTAATLLAQADLPNEAYLGIGNLAGRYCQQHSCDNVDAVNKLAQKLIQKVGDGKVKDRAKENEIIFALKALRNFGYLGDQVLQKIISIAQDKTAPNRVRAVALETYLADPCKDKIRNSALAVLQDIQQDAEVRIKAYLVAAQCPNAKVGNTVKALLEKEPSYQVGGFIVSHIRKVKSSANPDWELAKKFLGFTVPKRFPIDLRKWSYSGEFSYAFDTLGLAASADANIIYSQDSFLPRSTGLNLTAEVFGHSFNFLEIQTRQENFDKLVEHYFGPKGILRTSSLGDLLKDNEALANKLYKHLDKKFDAALRSRRDVSRAEIESIGKAVQIKEHPLNKDFDLDISVKAFGSEILFNNINLHQKGLTPEAIIDKLVDGFVEGIDKLKQFRETLRSNLLFLDAEVDYPTSLGFPLRLAAEGTANVQIEAEGSVDVRALITGDDNAIRVKLVPSANIDVSGRLTLDALVVENGLKVVSTLYTATGGDLTVQSFNGITGRDIKFSIPVQKMELVSANHEIVFHSREQAGHEVNTPLKFAQSKDFSICIDHLSPFIGLAFCGEINGPNLAGKEIPNLPFPLAGDAKFSISIENEDVLEYHLRSQVNPEYTSYKLLLESIGKNKQPKVQIQLDAEISPEKYFKATATTPIVSAQLEGRITDNDNEKSLFGKAVYDQTEVYAKIGVAISGSPSRASYTPILDFKGPGGNEQLPFKVQGQVIVEKQGAQTKYIFDQVKINTPEGKVLSLNGNIGNNEQDIFSDLTISDGKQYGSLKGRLHLEPALVKFNAEVQNNVNPIVNFNIKGEFKQQSEEYSSFLQIIHGQDLSSKENRITYSGSLKQKYKKPNDYDVGLKVSLNYPLIGLDSKFEYEQTPKSLDYDLDFQYNDIKFGSELDVQINKKQRGDFHIEFEIHGLENQVDFKADRQVQGDQSKISNELQVNGKRLEVKGTVKHVVKPANVDVGAVLTVTLPTHNTPFKVDSGLKYNPNDIDVHHKVTSGSTVIVDAFIKANKQGNANGSFKVNVKDVLNVNGQLKADKGTGTADLFIDALTIKKQVKVDSSFQIQLGSTYNIDLTLYPSYQQDKNQKIVLSTHNKISPSNVDSKSSVNLLGKTLEVNVKGSRVGDKENGKLNGEFEVSFPNEQYLLGRLTSEHQETDGFINGNGVASLEYRKNKNAAGKKISLKATYKNTKPTEGLYDVLYNFAADDSNGNNINADLGVKRFKQNQDSTAEISTRVYGSLLKNPTNTNLKVNYGPNKLALEASANSGSDASFTLGSKYVLENVGKCSGEFNLQLTTSNKNFKTLKVELGGLTVKADSPKEKNELKVFGNVFADDDGSVPGPIVNFKGDCALRGNDNEGEIKATVDYSNLGPISVEGGYSNADNGKQFKYNAGLQYGQDKSFKIQSTLNRITENHYKVNSEIDTPYQDYRRTVLAVETKTNEEQKHVTSSLSVNTDGRIYTLDSDLQLSEISPFVDVKFKGADGKISQIHVKVNKVSDKKFTGEAKYLCERSNYLFEGSIDANVEDIEEFHIKINLNSPNLNINKYVIEVQNKPGKTGRRIQINIKSANKNIVSGSTNYNVHEEQGKYIVEGSGTLKVKEENKAANFKYISQRLTVEKNGEQGIDISFNAAVGDRAIDTEYKLTNKQFRVLESYCEKRKECANFELDSKINRIDADTYDHIVELNVNLRKLGIPDEFGAKAVTKRQKNSFDHTFDVHFQNQGTSTSKYQYRIYLNPKDGGILFTTPKRVISLEGKSDYPQNVKEGGKFSGDISFYLDKKNQPTRKASVGGWLLIDPNNHLINGEVKLIHPGLPRELRASITSEKTGKPANGQVNIRAEFDIFAQQPQKLIATYTSSYNGESAVVNYRDGLNVKSSGLGIDVQFSRETVFDRQTYSGEYSTKLKYHVGNSNYDNVASLKGNRNQVNILFRILNVDLLKADSKLTINKEEQIIDSEISSFDNNPIVSHFGLKNYNTLLYTVGFKNNPREKLQLNAGLIPGQIADIRADHVTGAGKVNLFHASVKLDDVNFLKPDYSVNSKAVENTLELCKQKFTQYFNGLQNTGKEFGNNIKKEAVQIEELSKNAQPNLQSVNDYYVGELQKVKNELMQDKSIQELAEVFRNLFGAIAQTISELVNKFSELIQDITSSFEKAFAGVVESIQNDLIPQLKELADKLTSVAIEISKSIVEIVSSYLATISQMIEKYQPEIQQIVSLFSEIGQDIARFIQKAYRQVSEIIAEVTRKIAEELKALPIFDELKAQYEEFIQNGLPSSEGIIGGLKEIAATIKDLVPTDLSIQPEIIQIVDVTVLYIEKKIKNEPVDDLAILDQLLTLDIAIFRKLINAIVTPDYEVPQGEVPISLDFLKKLPKLVAVKFSPISYILKEDPSDQIVAFLLSLLNNPRHWFPPFPLFAIVSQGQHIFTFDGKYLTFPGNCKYLLARDAVNGNFTIIGTYSNGHLNAITLADAHDSITLRKGGQVLLNNAAAELPVRKPELAAYRDYTMLHLVSTAGVKITCTPDLEGCGIFISGFYHAQVKGLLGTGNNEPYDDFTAANGKIVPNEGEFGNSYKIGNCQPVTVPKNEQKLENAACNKLFDWESPLKYCYPFVKTDNFKLACAHGLAANVKETELHISQAYVAACHVHNIPISVPSELVKCTNGDKPTAVGEKFSVKLPGKSADIVLVVDTAKTNEPVYKDLFQPLIQDIVKTLQNKGISDVQFHLIVYGGENKWPSHVTVSGKLTFKGKPPHVKFSDEPQEKIEVQGLLVTIKPFLEAFHSVLHDLKLAFGQDLQALTFSEAYFYPFRPNALKSIIVLNDRTCEVGKFFLLQKLRTLLYKNNQVSINLITPFKDISVRDAKKTKDVIGFNDKHVFTISQAKKSPEGSTELYKDLDYDDYCVDFTVRNRGNVFVTNNFVDAKADGKKQFIHVAAHNIVNELVSVEEGLDCECRMINPYNAYNVCKESYAKEK